MFPIPFNKPYRKSDGTLTPIDNAISSGGGGGSFTPDYENDRLIIGVHNDYNYFIPMQKEYIGQGIFGYEVTTNPDSSSVKAMIDLYSIIYEDGVIVDKQKIKTLVHNSDNNYSDEWISITYESLYWYIRFTNPLYKEDGTPYNSPTYWGYAAQVDYILLTENPS